MNKEKSQNMQDVEMEFLLCLTPLWKVLSISGSNDCKILEFPLVMHQSIQNSKSQ